MKTTLTITGIVLILLGIFSFAYPGFTYKEEKPVADIGPIHVAQEEQKRVSLPPLAGGLAIVAGIVLVVVGRWKVK
jgi:uncharacterized protein YjeT (DUF2065 family)